MKRNKLIRLVSLALVLLMALPNTVALAEHITSNGGYVQTYLEKDLDTPSGVNVRVNDENATNDGGWYRVSSSMGYVWVPEGSVQVVQPEPTASPTPSPTPTITPTPDPNATPTPTPAVIEGDKDASYTGTILSYTVPTGSGGLFLYASRSASSASEVIPAGQTVKLTSVEPDSGTAIVWYTCLYNSKTYYVPASSLYGSSDSSSSTPNQNIKSVTIKDYSAEDPDKQVWYYDSYRASDSWGTALAQLQQGKRINATYVDAYAYSFTATDGGVTKTYYFKSADVEGNSGSSASVVDGSEVNLVTQITISGPRTKFTDDVTDPANPVEVDDRVKLFRSTSSSTSGDYYPLEIQANNSVTLNAQNDKEGWYKVSYRNEIFYLFKEHLTSGVDYSKVANNNTVETATFYVTIGENGGKLYTTSSPATIYDPPYADAEIPAGSNVRVGSLNANWYTYSMNGVTYYLNKKDTSGYSTSTSNVSAYKLKLYKPTPLYDRMGTSTAVGTDPLTYPLSENGTDGDNNPVVYYYNEYVVHSVNEEYFSIDISGKTYYIKKSELGQKNSSSEIASVTGGQTYTITIGGMTATLYKDIACTTASNYTYSPGKVLTATKMTDSVFKVNEGGVDLYLPVAYIASIGGGDNTSGSKNDNNGGNVGDVIQGEKDDSYDKDLFSFTVKAGGLWLYRTPDKSTTPSLSIDAGKVIQLSEYTPKANENLGDSWYTTWYGSATYYVPKSSLSASSSAATAGSSLSITLQADVPLYTDSALTKKSNETLPAFNNNVQIRYNVKVVSLLSQADKNALPPDYVDDMSKNYAKVYSVVHAGNTRYFPAYSSYNKDANANVDPDDILDALVASNTDATLMTKFTFSGELALYSSASKSSSSLLVKPKDLGTADKEVTVYGIKSGTEGWYRVIYNNSVWFLYRPDYNSMVTSGDADDAFQIAVAGDVSSNTMTVTIGTGGAAVYKSASASTNNIYYPSGSTTAGKLAGGTTVTATLSGGWYSCLYPGTTDTVYFQLSGGNTTTNATSRSYVIHIGTGVLNGGKINVYSTITTSLLSPVSGLGLTEGETYTLRTVDSIWSSVTLSGKTYYVRNSDIPNSVRDSSTTVGSTTVGKTYTITLGNKDVAQNPIPKYSDNKLTTSSGTIPAGTTLTGTKLYVEGSKSSSNLVYQVNHNGTAYVDSKYVVGVKEGDEVDEAKEAENIGSSVYTMTIGESRYFSVNAGTKVYTAMSTSSTSLELPITATYLMTRVDANWLRLTYNGTYYYLPISQIEDDGTSGETGGNAGANIAVGTTFMHTLNATATAYSSPSTSSTVVGSVLPNILIRLTKISDLWYEYNNGSTSVYLTAADVFAGSGSSGGITNPGTTTDGTGIITPYIKITGGTGTVNLRKSPTTSSTALDRIPMDTQLANLGYEVDSSGKVWYKVTYKTRTGYVIGDYVAAVGTVSSGGSTADPSGDVGRTLTVNVSTVNIRSGAGTNHSIVGSMVKGAAVVPTGYSTGNDGMYWYKFQYNASTVGYIRYDYVSGGIATNTELSGNVAIRQGGTNLRSGAGDSFSVKAQLARDTVVTIVGSGTDKNNTLWYRVTYQNLNGYVRSDTVRQLTTGESSGLFDDIIASYTELKYGSKGEAVTALQNQLIRLGYLAAGSADGTYGTKTTNAVTAFQKDKGYAQNGVASPTVQAAIFNATSTSSGSTNTLDWFNTGYALINANPNITVYDINSGITWSAKYVEGKNHADVVPATQADANKLKANNITGSYVRRPVLVTIAGQRFAGSMYAVGHGTANFVSFFSGVMCIHFTGSKTHGTGNVDADHQSAINDALQYGNQ